MKSVICLPRAFWKDLAAQLGRTLPAAQETWVPSLDQEDPLEKAMANTPVFLPGQSHGQRSLAGYSPWGYSVRHGWATDAHPLALEEGACPGSFSGGFAQLSGTAGNMSIQDGHLLKRTPRQ